jgi:hypothetical protein
MHHVYQLHLLLRCHLLLLLPLVVYYEGLQCWARLCAEAAAAVKARAAEAQTILEAAAGAAIC